MHLDEFVGECGHRLTMCEAHRQYEQAEHIAMSETDND
jgi:hypothetical protein